MTDNMELAQNPDSPIDTLIKLASDEDPVVRRGVALNPNIPINLLTQLASDEDLVVRLNVAFHSSASSEILNMLATDEHEFVRNAVAKNSNTPIDLVIKTAQFSKEMTNIMVEREVLNGEGELKKLNEISSSDLYEIYDEIASLSDYPGWEVLRMEPVADEWQKLCFYCSKAASDLTSSLLFLQILIERVGSSEDNNSWLSTGISEIRKRILFNNNLSIEEKTLAFKRFISEEADHWENPVSTVVMILSWNIPIKEIDNLIIMYEAMRTNSLFADEPWSDDPEQSDKCEWMPLLVIAVLFSSGSDEVLRIVDRTCRTSSATPFWMLICGLSLYLAESAIRDKYEDYDWFPEPFWKEEVFNHLYKGLKINVQTLTSLMDLYVQNASYWIWTGNYLSSQTQIDEFLADLTSE